MGKQQRKVEWSLDLGNMQARAGQFVTEMMGGTEDAKEATLREPLAGAISGGASIAFSVGRASVKALESESPNLFEAELRYFGDFAYDARGGAERLITLRQKADFPREFAAALNKTRDLSWDIGLAQGIPWTLSLRGGVGEVELDLSRLRVKSITSETGIGKLMLVLPAQDQPIEAQITGGVGLTVLALPAGAYGDLQIKGGVGEVRVRAAAGAALRIYGKQGLGALDLPKDRLQAEQASDRRESGTWQTPDFEVAEKRTVIDFVGGVGRFKLQLDEPS